MDAHAQTLLDVRATPSALSRREARGHSHDVMASSCSLVFKDVEEHALARVVYAFRAMVVLYHPTDVQVLHTEATISLGIMLGGLKVEVAPLAADLQMLPGDLPTRRAAAMTALLAATDRALSVRQPLLAP